jgi:hypothetical protein
MLLDTTFLLLAPWSFLVVSASLLYAFFASIAARVLLALVFAQAVAHYWYATRNRVYRHSSSKKEHTSEKGRTATTTPGRLRVLQVTA